MSWAQGCAGTTICGHKAFFLYVSSWQQAVINMSTRTKHHNGLAMCSNQVFLFQLF